MDDAQRSPTRRQDALIEELAAEIRRRRIILFVGAGVSAGLGLPAWDTFIGRLGPELGIDPDVFLDLSTDLRSLAEFYRLEKGSLDGLCARMKREWDVSDEALAASLVHRHIARLGFPLIYTTNYDPLLERAFALHELPFNKAATAKDIARRDPRIATIVKFHGDLEDPDSLVLTESDYFRRLAFEDPLDIQLIADALGRGVLFLGYSVSDVNLRVLLFRLRRIWLESGQSEWRPRSYIVMTRSDRIQERVLDSLGVAPLIIDTDEPHDESRGLIGFLERLSLLVAGGSSLVDDGFGNESAA